MIEAVSGERPCPFGDRDHADEPILTGFLVSTELDVPDAIALPALAIQDRLLDLRTDFVEQAWRRGTTTVNSLPDLTFMLAMLTSIRNKCI